MATEEKKAVFFVMRKGVVLVSAALLLISLMSCIQKQSKEQVPQVLLILREYVGSSVIEQYMSTNEAIVMKSMLEEAGFNQ